MIYWGGNVSVALRYMFKTNFPWCNKIQLAQKYLGTLSLNAPWLWAWHKAKVRSKFQQIRGM